MGHAQKHTMKSMHTYYAKKSLKSGSKLNLCFVSPFNFLKQFYVLNEFEEAKYFLRCRLIWIQLPPLPSYHTFLTSL